MRALIGSVGKKAALAEGTRRGVGLPAVMSPPGPRAFAGAFVLSARVVDPSSFALAAKDAVLLLLRLSVGAAAGGT